MRQLALAIFTPPAPTLDGFVRGRNVELCLALERLAAGAGDERFLYLWGVAGSGRSHLLQAVAAGAMSAGLPGVYLGNDADAATIGDQRESSLVCIDDVDRLAPVAQHALFVLINRLREGGGALLAAGPIAPAGLTLRPDLVTRLGWGLVYEVHRLDDHEKSGAMRARARALGFELAEEVCSYLLRHGRRDLPALLAFVDALDRSSLELRRPVSIALAREVLQLAAEPAGEGTGG